MAAKEIKLNTIQRTISLWLFGPIAAWLLLSFSVTALFCIVNLIKALIVASLSGVLMILGLAVVMPGLLLAFAWFPVLKARDALSTPDTITITDDGAVIFHFVFHSARIRAADMLGIRKVSYCVSSFWFRRLPGIYIITQGWWIYLDYRRGRKIAHIRFDASMLTDLFELYGELKNHNPAITYDFVEKEKWEP